MWDVCDKHLCFASKQSLCIYIYIIHVIVAFEVKRPQGVLIRREHFAQHEDAIPAFKMEAACQGMIMKAAVTTTISSKWPPVVAGSIPFGKSREDVGDELDTPNCELSCFKLLSPP